MHPKPSSEKSTESPSRQRSEALENELAEVASLPEGKRTSERDGKPKGAGSPGSDDPEASPTSPRTQG